MKKTACNKHSQSLIAIDRKVIQFGRYYNQVDRYIYPKDPGQFSFKQGHNTVYTMFNIDKVNVLANKIEWSMPNVFVIYQ